MSPLYFAVGSYDRLANEVPLSASEILPLGIVELLLISVPALAGSADVELKWVIPEVRLESSGSSPEFCFVLLELRIFTSNGSDSLRDDRNTPLALRPEQSR